ncbi:MAG: hypothetical protein HY902_02715, partial [Deltaproteobacteria bacterium]|nr:hypothetical protein [Deltaproteobacteria bacterium]
MKKLASASRFAVVALGLLVWVGCGDDMAITGEGGAADGDGSASILDISGFGDTSLGDLPKVDSTAPDAGPDDGSGGTDAAGNPCSGPQQCPQPTDSCHLAACDQGVCSLVLAADATPCDDGDACTTGETCKAGACQGGKATPCDDGSPCTADSCDKSSGCKHEPAAGTCSDGSECTVGDSCAGGVCVAGAAPSCDDKNVCTTDTCDPSAGCAHAPASGVCSDDNPCTTGDLCQDGKCQAGAASDCDDKNPCTKDSCDIAAGCTTTADDTLGCSDDTACTAGD